jgi:DNA invertase Pin-like site-specific DNA recombinase
MNGPASQRDAAALSAARHAILVAADGRGWREVDRAWIEEAGLSASDLGRTGVAAALEGLRRPRSRALVVAKRDRVVPSLGDVGRMMDDVTNHQWALVALALGVRTTHGRVVIATFAPYERRFLAERTRAAMAARRAAGIRLGRRRAVPEDVVERIVAERRDGASLAAIARGLDADGISGSAGGRWYASTVRSVLVSLEREARSRSVSAGL